jgi:hypothetical protein
MDAAERDGTLERCNNVGSDIARVVAADIEFPEAAGESPLTRLHHHADRVVKVLGSGGDSLASVPIGHSSCASESRSTLDTVRNHLLVASPVSG